jgi:hypothetical protein
VHQTNASQVKTKAYFRRLIIWELHCLFCGVYDKNAAKQPDLLVYETDTLTAAEQKLLSGRDFSEENRDKFEARGELGFVIAKALAAIEVEFSPYKASEMTGRNWKPRTTQEWERRPLKNAKPPTAPNIWVKEEDLSRLIAWESEFGIPIVVAHLFDQEAFAVPLSAVTGFNKLYCREGSNKVRLQMTTGIFKIEQTYDRIDASGARERKIAFVVTPAAAMKAGDVKDVKVRAQLGLSTSKKYVTHCLFSGGRLALSPDFVAFLKEAKGHRPGGPHSPTKGVNRVSESPSELSLWPRSDNPSD